MSSGLLGYSPKSRIASAGFSGEVLAQYTTLDLIHVKLYNEGFCIYRIDRAVCFFRIDTIEDHLDHLNVFQLSATAISLRSMVHG